MERIGVKINLRPDISHWLRETEIRWGRTPTVLCTAGLLLLQRLTAEERTRTLILAQMIDAEILDRPRYEEMLALPPRDFEVALEALIGQALAGAPDTED